METTQMLKQTTLFTQLSETDLAALGQSTRLESFKTGHVILREGRVGAAFYLILSGEVEVIKSMASAEAAIIGRIGPGEFFGEIGAMKHVTRSASVLAVEETSCLVIRRLDLDSYIERYPEIAGKIDSALSSRFGNRFRD
jgi:CRP-like cAMP-binding protein